MGTAIRFREGDATILLTSDLAARMAERVRRASSGMVAVIEQALEPVAANAEAEWYGPRGVKVDVVTTVDATRSTATVAVGSKATDLAKGKPRVVYIHSPGVMALSWESVDERTYWRTPKSLQGPFKRPPGWQPKPGEERLTFPVVLRVDPMGGKGHGFLLQTLIKAPARKAIKFVTPKLAKAATGSR
jgi:hypothetical protein